MIGPTESYVDRDGVAAHHPFASIIIPTFNGASRISACLDSLHAEIAGRNVEVLVIDDGSTDSTVGVIRGHPWARVISQPNAGPATARNRGAIEAVGELLLFTDDDCVPAAGWLDAMRAPFADSSVVGAKGVYSTHQRSMVARFVQHEYEDKYRLMAALPAIDFVDTYSAAFRRDRFLEMNGYDTSFPVACAEDVELSYRMSRRGWIMKFVPAAVVFHTHPETLTKYLKKKYKFALWRVVAVRKNPQKAIKDSHTPQTMKLQLLLLPALVMGILADARFRPRFSVTLAVTAVFALGTLPFVFRVIKKDLPVALVSPLFLAARSCAQFLGIAAGLIKIGRGAIRRTLHERPA